MRSIGNKITLIVIVASFVAQTILAASMVPIVIEKIDHPTETVVLPAILEKGLKVDKVALTMTTTTLAPSLSPEQKTEKSEWSKEMPIPSANPKDNAVDAVEIEAEECKDEHYSFSVADYSCVIGMLVISVGIGVFFGFFQKSKSSESSSDFLMGSDMNLLTVALSLTTSFITAIELLGNPAEVYFNGMQYALIIISLLFVVPVAWHIFYPIFFKMELSSCYEYLGVRFSKRMRIFGAILYILQMSFYTAVAVLAPAIAVSKATGLSTTIAVVFIYAVCIFYASQGGMKAVVIADTFQAVVLFVSLILIVVVGSIMVDDFGDMWKAAQVGGRLDVLQLDMNPMVRHSVWSVLIGGFFYWTSLFCTNQAAVQKCMSLRKLTRARHALLLAVLGVVAIFVINFYTGILIFDKYRTCDPLSIGAIGAVDQLLPHYVMEMFGHITSFTGIFVAGIFAASLGTVAAALNSLAAVTLEDVVVTGMNVKIDPKKGAYYAKWISAGYGIFTFGLVFVVERLGGILQVTLTLNGLLGGVTLGLFALGIFFKMANSTGAFYGTLVSLFSVVFVGIMAQFETVTPIELQLSVDECNCTENASAIAPVAPHEDFSMFRISYMWYPFLGCILTILFSLIISYLDTTIKYRNVVKINNKHQNQSQQLPTGGDFYSANVNRTTAGIDNIAYSNEKY